MRVVKIITDQPPYHLFGYGGKPAPVSVYILGLKSTTPEAAIATVRQEILKEVEAIYRPDTSTFNALIVKPKDFPERRNLSGIEGVTLYEGVQADGVVLHRRSALLLETADCLTVVALNRATGEVAAAHAGRASLINESRLRLAKNLARLHESVVSMMVQKLLDHRGLNDLRDIETFSGCGISPFHFGHDQSDVTYGEWNTLLIADLLNRYGHDVILGNSSLGMIKLRELVAVQFAREGVPTDNMFQDRLDTYQGRDEHNHHLWFSRRRATETGEGCPNGRNQILVVRHF